MWEDKVMRMIMLLIGVHFSVFAQDGLQISGKVLNQQGKPIKEAVVCKFGKTRGASSNADGSYVLNTDRDTCAYQVVANGYRSQIFDLTQGRLDSMKDGKVQVSFALRKEGENLLPKKQNEQEKKEPYLMYNGSFLLKDYEVTDNGFLILAKGNSLFDHRQRLMYVGFDGKVNHEEINNDPQLEILKDASNQVYINCNSVVQEVCLENHSFRKGMKFQEEDFMKNIPLQSAVRTQKVYEPNWNLSVNNSTAMIGTEKLSGMKNPQLKVKGGLYEFDFEKMLLKTGLSETALNKEIKLSFKPAKDDLLITDEENTDVYIISNKSERTQLMHVDLASGKIDKEINLPFHPHPDKIRIKNNHVFYMHKEALSEQPTEKLYCYEIK